MTAHKWILRIGLLLVIVLSPIILYNVFAYSVVLKHPQYVHVLRFPRVSLDEIILNGRKVSLGGNLWNVGYENPLPYLSGIGTITFFTKIDDARLEVDISYLDTSIDDKFHSTDSNILNKVIKDIRVVRDGNYYARRWPDEHYWLYNYQLAHQLACGNQTITGAIIHPVSGSFSIPSYKQDFKKIDLRAYFGEITATLQRTPFVKCLNDSFDSNDDFIKLEIHNFRIDLSDSPVIYEWSNKAGKTWRL